MFSLHAAARFANKYLLSTTVSGVDGGCQALFEKTLYLSQCACVRGM